MKKSTLAGFWVCLLFAVLLGDSQQVTIKYPSDLLAGGAKGSTRFSLDFVLRPIGDFRLMYCDEETLQRRIEAGVCVLDFDHPYGKHAEIRIPTQVTLGDVLKQSGEKRLERWNGIGQPSIRIISRRAILAHDGTEQFLLAKISAGDFIVVGSTF